MKKIEGKSKGVHHSSVNLFRDDLEKIIDILSEISESIVISDDEFVYDSLDELENEKGLNPKKINLRIYSPYVSIDIEPYSVWLYRGESDKDTIYAFKTIEEILKKRRITLSKIFNLPVGIIVVLFLVLLLFIPNETIKIWFPSKWSRLALIVFFIAIPTMSFAMRNGAFSSISLQKSHKQTSFFSRQKDDLIKIVIGALIGALLTLLITYIMKMTLL